MKTQFSLPKFVFVSLAGLSLGLLAWPAALEAQVSWQRQAYGQGPFYAPGHQGDPAFSYVYPNNNDWSQELTFAYDGNGKPIYVSAPSNWSTDTYPRGGDVTLGIPACNLDRFVKSGTQGGVLGLTSLTVQADGQLNIEAGVRLTLSLLNLQGINGNDATITVNGGGGALPVLILTPGGTLKKTTGNSSYTLDTYITLQVPNGGTIAADTGALQLPHGAYAGGVNFNAATGALIDLAPADAVDSGVVQFTGAFTGINTGGTVRLSKGTISTDFAGSGGVTLNFGGDTFQWTGGRIQNRPPDMFTNLGTINITGGVNIGGLGFINQGTIIESGAGQLNLTGLTNAATGVIELRNDAGIGGGGGVLKNSGALRKSAGSGTAIIEQGFDFDNTGTVAVTSGTLQFASNVAQVSGSTLNGGTWNIGANATLALSRHNALTINQGNVALSGVNANFTNFTNAGVTSLADNRGAFRLDGGNELSTAGALSNSGTFGVGAGSTLHVRGSLSLAGSSTLASGVGGANASGPGSAGVIQVNGAAALAGNLAVTLAPGAQIGAGDTITVLTSGSPLGGSFANVANGARLATTDGGGSFQVNYGAGSRFAAGSVVLSSFVGGSLPAHPPFFAGEVALSNGVYYLQFPGGNPFGYYSYLSDPRYIFHQDLGYEFVFDAGDGKSGVYFYDFASGSFFYTSPSFPFPYLYDFSLGATLYYYPQANNPGRYTTGPRYFFNFGTGKIITK